MLTRGEQYDKLMEYGYPEQVARDMTNYFSSDEVIRYIEWLAEENA